ncbi:hypothetical protein GCM10009727_03460 [Actinomadura napierensis]|uniref:Uncharacterized protein n=1 Tax=Actinomadura napierensis TaxID=267854 RepID=A0ABN2Y096_9ACTN
MLLRALHLDRDKLPFEVDVRRLTDAWRAGTTSRGKACGGSWWTRVHHVDADLSEDALDVGPSAWSLLRFHLLL